MGLPLYYYLINNRTKSGALSWPAAEGIVYAIPIIITSTAVLFAM